MRRLIGRVLAWFLREYLVTGSVAGSGRADEYVQIQKASFMDGRWNVQVRVFTRGGTIHKTVFVDTLDKATIRTAAEVQ